jgi:hypothetical protein
MSGYGFSNSQAGAMAEFDARIRGGGSLFGLGSPGINCDHKDDLDVV